MPTITYPYIPEGRSISYVGMDNPWMRLAREVAVHHSLDKTMPGGAIIALSTATTDVRPPVFLLDRAADARLTKHGMLGFGGNGSSYHEQRGCERVRRGCKSGQGYDLCEGCHPRNHSEPTAIRDAIARGNETALRSGASLYLWGHWWCCKDCWDAMEAAGIGYVYLLTGSEMLFNKDAPGNIIGRQFSATE